jgi:hypothetical protein
VPSSPYFLRPVGDPDRASCTLCGERRYRVRWRPTGEVVVLACRYCDYLDHWPTVRAAGAA